MANAQTGADPAVQNSLNDLSREVRFGAVLYGGVSLAVYENGVAQELFLATKGAGIYTVIKQLTGSDILLDIISGTSAGGINGILIGYALANNKDPSRCGDLWRQDGDLLKLLHSPSAHAPNSILNSHDYYQPRLEQAFAGISDDYKKSNPDDLESEIEDLDLFITGTNAYGHVYTEFDSFGHAIDVKNHRALFNLRYRRWINEDNDFRYDPRVYAKLCRITSCFPVAFEPVAVNIDPNEKASDEHLRKWGKLTDDQQYYLDGGILNNKPFSSTLGAIFHHTQTRDVQRFLIYVEPDPERFHVDGSIQAPDVMKAAAEGLSSIPGYQSIAEDLDAIAKHNNWAERFQELANSLNETSESLMKEYNFRVPASISQLDSAPPEQTVIYIRSRLTQLRERVLEGILKIGGHLQRLDDDRSRKAAEALVSKFESWNRQSVFAQITGLGSMVLTFDVYYRMRRLFHVTDAISDLLNKNDTKKAAEEDRKKYRELWRRLNHRLRLLDIIRSKMEQLIDCAEFHWKELPSVDDARASELWQNARGLIGYLLDPSGLPELGTELRDWETVAEKDRIKVEKQERIDLYAALNERVAEKVKFSEDHHGAWDLSLPARTLLQQTDDQEWEIFKTWAPKHDTDVISQHYCRFIYVDLYLFPMQYTSGSESTDRVTIVRFSPRDAKLGFSKDPKKKLCGDELWHFGGFLKSSWRANDLMWGRLDAASQVIESVLTAKTLKDLNANERSYIMDSLRLRCKNSNAAELGALEENLERLASASNDNEKQTAFEQLREELVYTAQREILQTEIPKVIEASIAQQAAWNQYDLPEEFTKLDAKLRSGKKPRWFRWRADRYKGDRAVTTYAATSYAREFGKRAAPLPPGWGAAYFRYNYDFRDETLQQGVPGSILIEMLTTMLLVLKKCAIGAGGGSGSLARSMLVWTVTFPIWLLYTLTTVQRRAPEYVSTLLVAAVVSSLLLLYLDSHLNVRFREHQYLWVIPLLLLLVVVFVLAFTYRRHRHLADDFDTVTRPQ